MVKIKAIVFVSFFAFLLQSLNAYSFEIGTHEELSDRAVRSSSLDNILKTQLNFLYGISDTVNNRTVIDSVKDGSRREDDFPRFCNHFHNPLETWDQAGLELPIPIPFFCGATNHSSVLWEQGPALQPAGQRFTWQDARQSFFQGLTATTQAEREAQLARTFRALGQLIHLVQDAAVPAHTRNDQHLGFEGFESFVENTRSTNTTLFEQLTNSSTGFDTTILTLSPNPLAPIPIARIIDTTDPEQADATPSAGTNVGIAEYSNANFLSGDTIFKDFTFPRVASLGNPFDGTDPVTGYPRSYFPKVADGETGFRLVAKGTWTERLTSVLAGDQGYILDGGVYEDYARLLLRRAIGYSAGLLNYFFRGQFSADPVSAGGSAQLAFDLRHLTPGEDFAGTAAIYYDNTAGQRVPVTGLAPSSITFTATAPVVRVSFDRPPDNPSDAYVIVLMGRLGQEDLTPGNPAGAIMARVTRIARQTTPVATNAALATAPDGSLILVWQQLDSGGRRLLYNRLTPDGTDLVAPTPVFAFGASFLHPPVNLAVGPDGHAHLAFKQAFSTGATRIRYVRVGLDGGVVASSIAAGTVETAVGSASLAVDPQTGLPSVVYFERQDLDSVTPLRIRAVHLNASGIQVGSRDFLLKFGAGAGANDFDAGTAVTADATGALAAVWLAKIGVAGDTGYNLYIPGASPTAPIRLTEGALRNQVLFDLFHTPVPRAASDGTLHLAWGHTLGGRPAVFYGTRPAGGLAFTSAGEVPATPSSDSRRPQFVLPTPTRTVLTWTRDFTDVALAEFDPSQPGLPTTRAATNISNTAALSTDSSIALTVDSNTGTERRVLSYTDASEGGNNISLQFYTPLILDVSPNPARIGQAVTVTGEGFGAAPLMEGRVTLNGIPLGIGSWSDTAITVTMPAGATSGPLVVEAQGASDAMTLEVLP